MDCKPSGSQEMSHVTVGVEDYIHRIGRTGRAGATGEAYTFFTAPDGKYARELARVLREAGQVGQRNSHQPLWHC